MNVLASALPVVTALLTLCGIVYSLLALWAAHSFQRASDSLPARGTGLPSVSILKPLRGVDPAMAAGFASHCQQQYAAPFEIIFGVSTLEDPAVAEVARLRVEYPQIPMKLVECAQRLGPNGKLSSLVQMLPHAQYEHLVVNDSDILVSPRYLEHTMAPFAAQAMDVEADKRLGLVTVPYFGYAGRTAWSRLEAMGIATDFVPGVLVARWLEGGLRFGLGSTLATTKTALAAIGGFQSLTAELADDYEMGARLHRAGFRVEMVPEIVATTVPPYSWRGFAEHQLRWARSTRDSRRAGYLGLMVTYVLPWAVLTMAASGLTLWSLALFSLALLVRTAVALRVGVGLLRDGQVLRDIVLLPVRDALGLFFWAWSYASDVVVWRGERFRLRRGKLQRL